MARKVYVDLSDTINTFRLKTNTLGQQIGDLDDLTTGGSRSGDNGFIGKDSDVVEALNHVYDLAYIDSNQIKEHHIDTHAISGRNIDSDVITSHHLAVSGTGGYSLLGGGVQYQFLRSDGDGTFTWAIPPTTNYAAGLGISKSTIGDSSGVFNVAGGHGLTQEASGLKLEDMPANTVKVRDANTGGASSNKVLTSKQILICDGTGFTAAMLSQDVAMTSGGVVTIQPQVVTNAKMGGMLANTVKVNATSGAASPTDFPMDNNTLLAKVGAANINDLSISTNSVVARAAGDLVSFSVPVNTVLGRVAGNMVAAQVATNQIANNAVTTVKILNNAVTTAKILNNNVTTAKILNDNVTYAKIQNVATANRVLGSTAAGGIVAEVQVKGDMLQNKVTLIIYNSAGSAVKTLYGAGS